MSEPLGALVVGTGFGVLTHLRALRAAGIEVRGLVGRDPARTRERAAGAGVPHALTDLTQALALPGVDLVSVATPPHTHAGIVLPAIAAGKHVMCEKPFAANAQEAERMLDAAERAGIVHVLGTEFRWSTGQALAARAIRAGAIGEPRLATFTLLMPVLADPGAVVPQWWGDARQGGGWLGAFASHWIDQMRTSLGEWTGLSASLSLLSDHPWSADDTFTVHFRTDRGCHGVLQSSAGAWGPPVVVSRISGREGSLWIEGDRVSVADAEGTRVLPVPEELRNPPPDPPDPALLHTAYDMLHSMGIDVAPFTKLFAHMRDTILGRPVPADPVPGTFADGLALQRILDAARRSSERGSWERP